MFVEGTLRQRDDGRFEMVDINGNYITYFTCGDPLELFWEDKWFSGRVEYTDDRGYYLLNTEKNLTLWEGDKVMVKK